MQQNKEPKGSLSTTAFNTGGSTDNSTSAASTCTGPLHADKFRWAGHGRTGLPTNERIYSGYINMTHHCLRSQLIPSHWWHRGQSYPLSHLQGAFAVAVGIAHPEAFLTALHQLNIVIDHLLQFPDHHPLPELPTGCIVTEKDAARLPPDADVWALCMSLQVDNPNFVIDQLELCLSPLAF